MSLLSAAQLKRQYGIKPRLVAALVAAGVVEPQYGARGVHMFAFQDVVLLRSAAVLNGADVKPAHLSRFLRALRNKLPSDAPLSSVRIALLGRELVVRIEDHFENAAGQLVLDFASAHTQHSAEVIVAAPERDSDPAEVLALTRLQRAETLELSDAPAAIRLYQEILRTEPDCVEAAMNLIVLYLESGRAAAAIKIARLAVARHPDDALLRFNFAVVCEELERFDEALLSYQLALQLDAGLADAHFNAAQIYDARGERRDALRHMAAYRRLHRG